MPDLSLPGIISPAFNATGTRPPQPFTTDMGDLHIEFSNYRDPIPLNAFTLLYINCVEEVWSSVAHERNTYPYPERKPVDNQAFLYEDRGFQFVLKQSSTAAVDWEYGELFDTLNALMAFAARYSMVEMDIEVVAGPGNFEGYITYDRRYGGRSAAF